MILWPMLAVYVQASGVPWLHACMAMHGLSPMNIVHVLEGEVATHNASLWNPLPACMIGSGSVSSQIRWREGKDRERCS